MQQTGMTRRHAVVASGVSILGLGAASVAFSGDAAAASVAFNVPDTEVERTDPVESVRLNVSATVEWAANQAPEGYELRLFVGPARDELDMLTYTLETEGVDAEGTETVQLGGDLADAEGFAAGDFALPETGETVQTVAAKLTFSLREGGERVVSESAETAMQLTLANGEITADVGIDASGEVVVK